MLAYFASYARMHGEFKPSLRTSTDKYAARKSENKFVSEKIQCGISTVDDLIEGTASPS